MKVNFEVLCNMFNCDPLVWVNEKLPGHRTGFLTHQKILFNFLIQV